MSSISYSPLGGYPQQTPSYYTRAHAPTAAAGHRSSGNRGYTLVHAGRQVRIGPVAFWIAVGTLIVMAIWSIGTGTYFAFSEAVLTRLIGRQAEMQFAYEDRIAELRTQIDRITSRQLLDQEQFEQKLDALGRRQAMLEHRAAQMSGEAGSAPRGPRGKQQPAKPTPISENDTPQNERQSWLPWGNSTGGPEARLNRIASALDRVENKQVSIVAAMEQDAEGKARRIRAILGELGVDLGKSHDITGAIGGPFVPLKRPNGDIGFDRQLSLARLAKAQADRLTTTLSAVPIGKPVEGDIDMSSPFGMRMDPFLRGPAIHTGVDLRGETGEPVHATANGTVVTASWQGGYGNMVEINHHNGLSTRFGHLSKILVRVGQKVRIGETIGLIGSTGRSTGPHLHYETRVHDSAVDPTKFLKAGHKLGRL